MQVLTDDPVKQIKSHWPVFFSDSVALVSLFSVIVSACWDFTYVCLGLCMGCVIGGGPTMYDPRWMASSMVVCL